MTSESGETELLNASEADDEPRQQAENGVPASFEPSKLAASDDTPFGCLEEDEEVMPKLNEVAPRRVSFKEGGISA